MQPQARHWLKIAIGTLSIVLWGFFFDDMARVGQWIFDSTYHASYDASMADLAGRYMDAHLAMVHGNLYRIGVQTFTYPPITAYLFVPFRMIGLRATMTVWSVGNLVALAVIFAIALRRWFKMSAVDAWFVSAVGLAPASVFAFYPMRSLLLWGQLGIFLMLLVILDLFVVPKRYRGVLIGCAAAIKLLPAVFVIWLLAKREYSAVARAAGSFLVLSVLAAALWPHASAEYWFHILPSGRVGRIAHQAPSLWNKGIGKLPDQSIRGMLGRPPFIWTGILPWAFFAAVVLAVGAMVTVKFILRRRELAAFVVLSVVTELASPVSWPHYWVFVVLAPLLAVHEWKRDRPLAVASIVLALSTCVDLENRALASAPFTSMSSIELFIVRNIYVLGGLVFLGVAAQRVLRRSDESEELNQGASADETLTNEPQDVASLLGNQPLGESRRTTST